MKFLQHMVLVGSLVMPLIAVGCAGGPQSASVGEHVDDSVITTKVKTALLRDPLVSGTDINVRTFKGRVQLNGFVDEAAQVEQAGRLAREVEGVTTVENNLAIK